MKFSSFNICFVLTFLFSSCQQLLEQDKRFELLSSSETGVSFNNLITETDSFTVLDFEYIYNGAGVGVGDFNNDGLPDILFAGNMVSSELYLNKGDLKFENITAKAGIATSTWCTGVAPIDINQDGWLDVYISTSHPNPDQSNPNLLFINQGLNKDGYPTFKESAKAAGLDAYNYSTQASFLDYDKDGDLDIYLLNNSMESYFKNGARSVKVDGTGKSTDKLFRNDGIDHTGTPIFKDVSQEAGILKEGWGLGIGIFDVNNDSYPDIYVANDFLSNDILYVNNTDGTFTNQISDYFRHQCHNGMGIDIADFNNDGLEDLIVLDMLPNDNFRHKTMLGAINTNRYDLSEKLGYEPQFMRNVFQLNNGNGSFSDIGYLAGVAATDWSWSPLFADFDNDGERDLLITNGYKKDITDQDFLNYNSSSFGTKEIQRRKLRDRLNALQPVKKPNFIFKNVGAYKFEDQAQKWGLDHPSYSNGAAYADFDNDGDLDLVTNNINDEAFIYKNNTVEHNKDSSSNFLRIKLIGEEGNLAGIGCLTKVYTEKQTILHRQALQRGYKSSVDPTIHIGLGAIENIDSILVKWSNGAFEKIISPPLNELIVVQEKNAKSGSINKNNDPKVPTIYDSGKTDLDYAHKENMHNDFNISGLLPHSFSQQGPGIAVGDVNGDNREDFFVGGSYGNSGVFFIQTAQQTFVQKSLPSKREEDLGALLFDADGDKDLDLYCVSGSSEGTYDISLFQDRLYMNDGSGNFELSDKALPKITTSGSCVIANDIDKDGDLDLFVGGRLVPGKYPLPAKSHLLLNEGGTFTDMTAELAPSLQEIGLVTSALWTDVDNDMDIDLMLVGEWMSPKVLTNEKGKFVLKKEDPTLNDLKGWFNSIAGGDFDNDGDTDYVLGNLGLNSRHKASKNEPMSIYCQDFDQNGSYDGIMTYFEQGKEYPVHPRKTLLHQLPVLGSELKTYKDYGMKTIDQIFDREELSSGLSLKATELRSVYLQNEGGKFIVKPLPVEAQISPIFGLQTLDINGDGYLDIVSVGNDYSTEVLTGRYDAGIGTIMIGNGKGSFKALSPASTGFKAIGNCKSLSSIYLDEQTALHIVGTNQDSIQCNKLSGKQFRLLDQNIESAIIYFNDGSKRKEEYYRGSGYLSQSSVMLQVTGEMKKILYNYYDGSTRSDRLH